MDLYCRPPGQVPVVLNSLISNVSEIYTKISRLLCRSWINVTQGRAVSEAEKGSCLKAIARESPSRLQPCSALLASGKLPRRKIFEERKKVAAFVDWEEVRADTGNQCKELDNIDTEDNTHRQLNQGTHDKKGPKILNHMFSQILDFFGLFRYLLLLLKTYPDKLYCTTS